ncbi:MAG: GGDEF domain-containing protein [Gammaproteobacteria bacterium]|nr:GGDEF domain-containing protein [Gammaproteobacteria bacterium]
MSTLAGNPRHPRHHEIAHKLAVNVFSETAARVPRLSDQSQLRLAKALQSSLQINEVLSTFAAEARLAVPGFSLRYQHAPEKAEFALGLAQAHGCAYRLDLHGHDLGTMTFTRDRLFATDELALFELLLCSLIYPLRNALLYERALRMATIDPLTRVQNRMGMEQYLGHEVSVAARHGTPMSLLLIDIDHFKSVNDLYGHQFGDRVLRETAQTIIRATRNSDVVFRYGGEEFVVILSNTKSAGALMLADRICGEVREAVIEEEMLRASVSVSIGVAELLDGDAPSDILRAADQRLYQAKARGRDRVVALS